jgi:DNA-directed RNA polymerase subunit L
MIEILGIISSIIGIAGGIWAVIRFILKPILRKRRDFREVINTIEKHFKTWKSVNYSFRKDPLIKYEDFLKINRFAPNLRKMNEEKMAFLLRNAVQHGLGGDWGYWLVVNKNNEKVIDALIPSLDGTAGWRPIWRSAYILERTAIGKINTLYNKLSDKLEKSRDVKFVFEIIKKIGTVRYLQSILESGQKELKDKAQKILQEIEVFSEQIEEYTKNRILISNDLPSDLRLRLKQLRHYPKIEMMEVFDFIIEMNRANVYSIHQISNACNVYATYLTKATSTNLKEVSAKIFGYEQSDIIDLEFSSYPVEDGKSYVMRSFVPKNFLQNCEGIKKFAEQWNKSLIVILQENSPKIQELFTSDEMIEMFANYVLPVSYWWFGKESCFFNPDLVESAGLA